MEEKNNNEENACNKKVQIINNFYENQILFEKLKELFEEKKLPTVIILKGLEGSGKKIFILNLIFKFLNGNININKNESEFNIKEIEDLLFISSEDKGNISVDEIRVIKEFLSLKSKASGFKFILIDSLDEINKNGLNAMLKILEEPNENCYFFLLSHQKVEILKTIESRSIIFNFKEQNLDSFLMIANQNSELKDLNTKEKDLLFQIAKTAGLALDILQYKGLELFYKIEKALKDKDSESCDFEIRNWIKLTKKETSFTQVKDILILILSYLAVRSTNKSSIKEKFEVFKELEVIIADLRNENVYLLFFYKLILKISKNISF